MPDSLPMPNRSFIDTRAGLLHVASQGEGLPVILLHQTPRSWDEYRDVLPIIGGAARAIAVDTPGYGDSPALPAPSIEVWAEAVLALLDALGLERACLVGHHTGAVIALEAAARAPERVAALVLSCCGLVDAERRRSHEVKVPVDTVTVDADGGHLIELWRGRQSFYPAGRPDLLDRFVVDALRAGAMATEGHRVVNRYRMEERIGRVRAPTLLIAATDDPHTFPSLPKLRAALPHAEVVEIPGGTVPLPDHKPEAFSAAVLGFLKGLDLL